MPDQAQEQEFVEYIVKGIVDHPDDVSTEHTIDEMGTLISLHVSAEDMGTIIGKEGRTAKALRTLLRVFGAKNDARVNLKIIEPEGGRTYSDQGEEGVTTEKSVDSEDVPTLQSDINDALKDVPQDELA
ncbi:MAG: KH domain-containing protein [bacterium]